MRNSQPTRFEFVADETGRDITAAEILAEVEAGKSVYVIDATITGPWQVSYTTIKGELVLRGCTVEGPFTADNAVFERRVELSAKTTFGAGVVFEGASFGRFVSLKGMIVHGAAGFTLAQFAEGLDASGAEFHGTTDFSRLDLHGTLDFREAQFLAPDAAGATVNSFYAGVIAGDALFGGARFKGKTSFDSLTVQGYAQIGMDSASPRLTAALRKATVFESAVEFGDACFQGAFDFVGGRVDGEASFAGTHFMDRANISTDFNSPDKVTRFNRAQFDGPVVFEARFKGGMWTFGARFADFVKFRGDCRIEKFADWQETRFTVIHFSKDNDLNKPAPQPFAGDADWRQCRYTALQHDDGRKGMEALWAVLKTNWRQQAESGKCGYEFNTQPYLQLEKACRRQGFEVLADEIYYEMRCRAQYFEPRMLFKLWEIAERGLFGWAVKPLRMIISFLLAWVAGTAVFCQPHMLVPLGEGAANAGGGWYAAALVSLRNLVPGLGEMKVLGLGPNWNSLPAAVTAGFQHVLGWVLLALLARRFFASLAHAGKDSGED